MPTPATSVVVSQLLVEALLEIRMGRAGDSLEPELLQWALGKLNRLFDKWNADPAAKFDIGFATYTPIANQQTYTIGPSAANWAVTNRPDRIKGANLILAGSTPAVRTPITVRDDQWWLTTAVQALTSAIVTDLWYQDAFPNGIVTLWPKPTTAVNLIELFSDAYLSQYAMADTLWLPFGYREAVTLTLAELLAPGCGQTVSQDLRSQAADARVIVFGNNVQTRNIRTRDGGMPGGGKRGGGYSYRTGRIA
jgi:hypothetical protein